jgi:HEPN domain-containing protein
MSLEKQHQEALRWLKTAEEDLGAARGLRSLKKHSHACFLAQQCGEKALKALWYALGHDPWGHSIQKLIVDMPDKASRQGLRAHLEAGVILDRYYIPTRYPNGLPDLTPGEVYLKQDSDLCIRHARAILTSAKSLIVNR